MEQYYKDGITYNSFIAIRNAMKDTSLPMLLTDSIVAELGFIKVVDNGANLQPNEKLISSQVTLIDGVPTVMYTVELKTAEELAEEQAQMVASMVQHFTDVTTNYIEAKVQAYNVANGLAFKDIDAFTKYAVNTASVHHSIANQFITYADNVWTAVRTYQSSATAVPTEAEFKVILDGVVF